MMQLLWIGLGLFIGVVVLAFDSDTYEVGAPFFYVAMMALLAVTIFIAPDIKGSRSWLVLGPVRLQPAEFAKVATSLTIAWMCNQYDFQFKDNAELPQDLRDHSPTRRSYPPTAGDGLGTGIPCPLPSPSSGKASRGSLWG